MTIQEKQSLRKKKSLLYLVEKGEYSVGYALLKTEELYDSGKLIDTDYDELANYLEELLNKAEIVEEIIEESIENAEDSTENTLEESVEDSTEENIERG